MHCANDSSECSNIVYIKFCYIRLCLCGASIPFSNGNAECLLYKAFVEIKSNFKKENREPIQRFIKNIKNFLPSLSKMKKKKKSVC